MNLLIGCGTMAVCLTIQCLVVSILLHALFVMDTRLAATAAIWRTSSILVVSMLIMMVGNLFQIAVWGGLFVLCGEFADYATAFYHSVVNFTTLGYGDVVMSENRRLLGALEAANGVLMFGLTSGFLFSLIYELSESQWNHLVARKAERSLSQQKSTETPPPG